MESGEHTLTLCETESVEGDEDEPDDEAHDFTDWLMDKNAEVNGKQLIGFNWDDLQ